MKRGSQVNLTPGSPPVPRPYFAETAPPETQPLRPNLPPYPRELFFLRVAGPSTTAPFSQPCLPVKDTGPTKILPYLFLGSYQDSINESELSNLGINYILNVSRGTARPGFVPEERFLRIPVDDNYDAVLTPYFDEAFDFIDKAKLNNGCVLVHCMAGISRSATVAIGYFMKEHNCTHEEAMRYVKERRPSIAPNFNFLGQLLELEKTMNTERMLRFHKGSPCARTSSESHIVRKSSELEDKIIVPINISSRSLSVAVDAPHAPKRSRTESLTSTTGAVPKTRPTGLMLGPLASSSGTEIDIETMVQSSLHVKTPEAQKENPLFSTTLGSCGIPGFLTDTQIGDIQIQSPGCEAGTESRSSPRATTPNSGSNKSSLNMESPVSGDDSVFKIPFLPSSSNQSETDPNSKTLKNVSPQFLRKLHSIPGNNKSSRMVRKGTLPSNFQTEPLIDPSSLFGSESKLFHGFSSKPLSPVEDCSPENTATGISLSASLRVSGISSEKPATPTKPKPDISPTPSSSNSSSTASSRAGPGTSTNPGTSTSFQMKPNYKDPKSFVKTKLMLSERLKFMIKHQASKTGQQIWNSEGNIVTRDGNKNRSNEGVVFRGHFPRARPSSFCLPSDYLEHWEEILAAAKLPSRSMSCNLLEVRSRQIGVRDWATSSSNSYDSLSRPSSLEAVEVGS